VADARIEESVVALRGFVAEHGSLLTAESWTEAAMLPVSRTESASIYRIATRDSGSMIGDAGAAFAYVGTAGAR
jgi:hypothetical protein